MTRALRGAWSRRGALLTLLAMTTVVVGGAVAVLSFAEAALGRFGIADLGDRQVEELSGGQMQRVACARGFVVGAGILLADEPTSELDEGNRSVVLAELHEEAARGSVVVVATHDPAVVDACDVHFALDEGRLVQGGLFQDRAVRG